VAAFLYKRDIHPLLPPPAAGPVVDIGCGCGEFVRVLQRDDFDAEGPTLWGGQADQRIADALEAGLDARSRELHPD
jgi:cyclopropane fatty-acyl-phospholipid synthase-like methyltransferase